MLTKEHRQRYQTMSGARPASYEQALQQAAEETAVKMIAPDFIKSIINSPDPIVQIGLTAILEGKITGEELGKAALNYTLGALGVPIGPISIMAVGLQIGMMLQAAIMQEWFKFVSVDEASLKATEAAMDIIEGDITAFEFVTWVYNQLEPLAKDAEDRIAAMELLKKAARGTKPPNGDSIIQALLDPKNAIPVQLEPCPAEQTIPFQRGDFYASTNGGFQ